MKILKVILMIVLVIAIIIVGGSFFLPKNSKVERSVMVGVPDSVAYSYIGDFSKFNDWSPWNEMEPEAETSYTGGIAEIGATYSWDGEKLGKGGFKIVSVEPNKAIFEELQFIEPWEGLADNNFFFEQVADSTKITWVYVQENKGIIEKWMGLGMDSMLGKDWDRGLSKIKTNLEKAK